MWYWIVMIMLAIGSIIMLAVSFAGIKRRNDMAVNVRPQGRGYGDDELSRRPRKEAAKESQDRPRKKVRRRWKIILYEKYLPLMRDGRISKVHCAIIHRGDSLYLKDEGSRNGTFLNGERLNGPVVLQRDDIIGLGETRLEVQRILRESQQ